MEIPQRLQDMLSGERGKTAAMAARLVVDLAYTAGASEFVEVKDAHVSGVSVITGGHGLIRFLNDLSGDGEVVIPTTLNSAGCDARRMEEMAIDYPDFLQKQFEIIKAYEDLGIAATLSCTPYDRGIELAEGIASWAESNAVCFANSFSSLITNRESGLSALATALTGFAPRWGLHLEENRQPQYVVDVSAELVDLVDWSILGDWAGSQASSSWDMPWGPMPIFTGLSNDASLAQRKALAAAAANHGCPMLWISEGADDDLPRLQFSQEVLASCKSELAPSGEVDLVVIGCPQASLEEIRRTASAIRARAEMGLRVPNERLWLFTSAHNHSLADAEGLVDLMEDAGVVILQDTCPEVVPYNRNLYNHLLTNSMKAEHYLTSGLNRLPTSVASIEECVSIAFDPDKVSGEKPTLDGKKSHAHTSQKTHREGDCLLRGSGLESQNDFIIRGRAMCSDVPITYLGYVNRDTGVVEESGHPLDGRALKDTILIYPKGSGSTVAPYVLMGLLYTGVGPKAIVNRDVCPLTLPAASLLDLPYAHGFGKDPCIEVNDGDLVELRRIGDEVVLEVIERVSQ